jgi:hypothetical protein
MLKCVILIPIGNSIDGQLIPQLLELQTWCNQNNSKILTIYGRPHNFARNGLATGLKGFTNPSPPDAEWLIWIDSDIVFTIKQLEDLLSINEDHKFVSGWYQSNISDEVMCGNMDKDYFDKYQSMPFLSAKSLIEETNKNIGFAIKVDFVGFGFCKIHRSIIEKMEYPYFTLNLQEYSGYKDISAEDVSFCQNCNNQTGIRPIVVGRLKVGHLKNIII